MIGINDENNDINISQRLRHTAIHGAIERIRVPGLKTRGINKHELGIRSGQNAHDAMTSSLSLARNDADLLADQTIQQR